MNNPLTAAETRPSPAAQKLNLPDSARMRQPKEFSRCMDAGKRLGGAYYRCIALLNSDGREGVARLGFAVSRKVDRRAVVRNRIKRVAREFFRQQRVHLPVGDYVFMGRREAAAATTTQLRRDLESLLPRLRALKPPAPQVTMTTDSSSTHAVSAAPAGPAPRPERDSPPTSSAEPVTGAGSDGASE